MLLGPFLPLLLSLLWSLTHYLMLCASYLAASYTMVSSIPSEAVDTVMQEYECRSAELTRARTALHITDEEIAALKLRREREEAQVAAISNTFLVGILREMMKFTVICTLLTGPKGSV